MFLTKIGKYKYPTCLPLNVAFVSLIFYSLWSYFQIPWYVSTLLFLRPHCSGRRDERSRGKRNGKQRQKLTGPIMHQAEAPHIPCEVRVMFFNSSLTVL